MTHKITQILIDSKGILSPDNWRQGSYFKAESDSLCMCAHGAVQVFANERVFSIVAPFLKQSSTHHSSPSTVERAVLMAEAASAADSPGKAASMACGTAKTPIDAASLAATAASRVEASLAARRGAASAVGAVDSAVAAAASVAVTEALASAAGYEADDVGAADVAFAGIKASHMGATAASEGAQHAEDAAVTPTNASTDAFTMAWNTRSSWVKGNLEAHYILGMVGLTTSFNDSAKSLQEVLVKFDEAIALSKVLLPE